MVRNRKLADEGFTLVEVLVVSIIIAILAAVAVPLYTGYIKNQKRQAAVSVAQTAAITASSFARRNGRIPTTEELNDAIALPNPDQFLVSVVACGTGNCVEVVEQSNRSDTAMGYAKF